MRAIRTLCLMLLVAGAPFGPAAATVYGKMYCWVPDFEIAIACDDDDESGDGDDTVRIVIPPQVRDVD